MDPYSRGSTETLLNEDLGTRFELLAVALPTTTLRE
jgi:hypothetical protein